MRPLLAVIALSACASIDSGEVVDQSGHYTQGRAMATELRRNTRGTAAEIEALVMQFAEGREALQHGDSCGEGCEMDLRWWRRGVRAALKGERDAPE